MLAPWETLQKSILLKIFFIFSYELLSSLYDIRYHHFAKKIMIFELMSKLIFSIFPIRLKNPRRDQPFLAS